jgi:uncharacterized membrane protein YfcA
MNYICFEISKIVYCPSGGMLMLGMILSGFGLAIAAPAGIGGGLLLVPINLFILGLIQKEAIAVSNATILGGALANLLVNIRMRRPNGRPLIDWSIVVVMEPLTMICARAGSLLNELLPMWITTTLLTSLAAFLSSDTFLRFRRLYKIETSKLMLQKDKNSCEIEPKKPKDFVGSSKHFKSNLHSISSLKKRNIGNIFDP